jgi:hypothetical protein
MLRTFMNVSHFNQLCQIIHMVINDGLEKSRHTRPRFHEGKLRRVSIDDTAS